MNTINEPITFKMPRIKNFEALAKLWNGSPFPYTYTNRKQAQNACSKLPTNAGWIVHQSTSSRVFYVGRWINTAQEPTT
jgi:hypothetical protein